MKKTSFVILSLAFAISMLTALPTTTATEGPYTYTLSGGKATITDCRTSFSGALSITNELGGYPVTTIGTSAFNRCRFQTDVTIPSTVSAIGEGAFASCSSLASVTIPDSVTTIGGCAFYLCSSLTSVTIPSSVITINNRTFYLCSSLTSVTIPSSVITIGNFAFCGSTSLTSVYFAGNAPTPGSSLFSSTPATVYYLPGTTGWGATYADRPTAVWKRQAP